MSESENELIKNAKEKYGIIFDHASKINHLLWNFMPECSFQAFLFSSLLSSVQTSLTLALLSAIREHDIQTNLLVRYGLESAVLACYSLHNPNIAEEYLKTNDDTDKQKNLHIKIKSNAYKWINDNFLSHSNAIKFFKDMINAHFAHANPLMSQRGFEFSDEEFKLSFFDRPDPLMTAQRIWFVAHTTYGILDLFAKLAASYPTIKPLDDFIPKLRELYLENMEIKNQLEKHPRFANALNKIRKND